MNKQRIITIGLIVLGLFITFFFGMKMLHSFKRFHRPGPFNEGPPSANSTDAELIRDWMTIPYIADTYDAPPDAIFFSLGIEPEKQAGKKSLKQLNDEYFPSQPGVVLAHVKALIKSFQSGTIPPSPIVPAPPQTP